MDKTRTHPMRLERLQLRKSVSHSPSLKRRLRENTYEQFELKKPSPSNTKSLINAIHEGLVDVVHDILNEQAYKKDIDGLDGLGLAFLHHAARYNRVEVSKLLIEHGADMNVRSDEGLTPLHFAARFDALATLEFLLSRGADPSIQDSQGNTTLHHAVKRGNKEITITLLKQPKIEADAKNNAQMTSLHLACTHGNSELCKVLLVYGADLRAQSGDQMSPLHLAVSSMSLEVAELLLTKALSQKIPSSILINEAYFDGSTTLHLAAHTADYNIVELCLDNGAKVNTQRSNQETALHIAAGKGCLEIVKLLVTRGADVHVTESDLSTSLHRAAALNRVDVVKFLVTSGAKLEATDSNNRTPFLTAVASGQKESAEALIGLGTSVQASDIINRNCLHICVENEHLDVLRMLLEKDAYSKCLYSPDIEDRYPIHYAALADEFKILEAILARDPIASLKDGSQQTPLHLAAMRGLTRHVEALVKYASGVNKSDEQGRTPLHNGAAAGQRKVCSILIQAGADVNLKDNNRWTPLMLASMSGCRKTTETLLNHQACINDVNMEGDSALVVAMAAGHPDCVTLLLDRGAGIKSRSLDKKKLKGFVYTAGSSAVAMALVKNDRWREILEISFIMENLIQHFPEAAKVVMDKSIHRSGLSSDTEYKITFDFRILNPSPDSEEALAGNSFFAPSTMVKYAREDLLLHPLTKKLIDTKWNSSGRYLYYFFFIFYLVFLVTYTIFIITEREAQKFRPRRTYKRDNDTSTVTEGGLSDTFGQTTKTAFHSVAMVIALAFVILHMLKEIIQMAVQRFRYFTDISNLTEWTLYLTTMVFMLPYLVPEKELQRWDADDLMRPNRLWICGVISIFLAYVNLILFLRRFRVFGLYVSMFLEVTKTVTLVLIPFFVFILAFAIAFFVLFKEQAAFGTIGKSIIRTSIMMIGEFDYESTFIATLNSTNSRGLLLNPIPQAAYFFLMLFLLLMTIVLMNLLIGLAVGDIETIQRNATLKRLAMMVNYVAEVENQYPRFFLRWVYLPRLTVRPNRKKIMNRFIGKKASQKTRELDASLQVSEDEQGSDLKYVTRQLQKNKRRTKCMMDMIQAQNRLLRSLARKIDPDGMEIDSDFEGEDWAIREVTEEDEQSRDGENRL